MTRGNMAGLATAIVLALAGCSGGQQDGAAGVETQFLGLERILGTERDSPAPPLVIVPQADAPAARLVAEMPSRGARATLRHTGTNGAVSTWRTADAVALSLRAPGVLVATRGLGADLHVADVDTTAAALAAGQGGTGARSHVRLGGDQRLTRASFTCTLRLAGRDSIPLDGVPRPADRFEEACTPRDGGLGFTNRYWRDPRGGAVLASEQWIGAEAGFVRLVHPAE